MVLHMPVPGYLEAAGPVPIRHVELVEVAPVRLKGGLGGRPLEVIDIADEFVAALRQTVATWELRQSTWSLPDLFEREPVKLIRIANPFGPEPPKPS